LQIQSAEPFVGKSRRVRILGALPGFHVRQISGERNQIRAFMAL
jgi:hypothetical protein